MARRALRDLDVGRMKPFARMVYDYLLSEQPTRLVADLAAETDINNQTIWDWLRKGVTPRRETIMTLGQKTGMPVDDLLRAAGLPTVAETVQERQGANRVLRKLAMRYAKALDKLMEEHPEFTESQRELLQRWAREELPAALGRGEDLRRELGLMEDNDPAE